MRISTAFQTFLTEAPGYAKIWMKTVHELGDTSALDNKTQTLAYLSVLAATRMTSGIPFHVDCAKAAGATREEITGAILIGLPAVGNTVIESLSIALAAFDRANGEKPCYPRAGGDPS
ncbi:carboxymuconolactone decarboxylase family protein [Pectobacteriaceae bacterium CE70]|uniref:Carboxymuconolactone decarboxylase family protein n=1 Tax=Serratia sp. (strain ATCC 39006) TaxID=104623 RepID=A0A2I5TLG8_SERS3|nr:MULTISPECIES: carboxymuconolactone decarboxylase family protein [Enterobacterales]WJV64292.1 carboxymuconolactone decarboxylase family protein [Pectobacteriaceae bacterium C52]WJV65277.1 carboxymuconolactone decarboxylase family protein [Pectobacteriaceae bacterium CE70]WJY09292.1 carboxymuconolactone decarboxylase family protein [Pectobacteriaceae bacterium C80]AUH01096.1 carboxymuconolactone decarboxylase family protein [Serratia sp. ATCC 39006]AUH05417.1 carboxymuconolactone decarboxylas